MNKYWQKYKKKRFICQETIELPRLKRYTIHITFLLTYTMVQIREGNPLGQMTPKKEKGEDGNHQHEKNKERKFKSASQQDELPSIIIAPDFQEEVEKNSPPKGEKDTEPSIAKKGKREKINFLPVEFALNKEIKPLVTEWKQSQGSKTKLFNSKLETSQFLEWIMHERATDISKKNYDAIMNLNLELTTPIENSTKKQEEEKMELTRDKINEIGQKEEEDEKERKLGHMRNAIQQTYNITLNEWGNPENDSDMIEIKKLTDILNGKIPEGTGFFKRIFGGISEKDRMKAKAFKHDVDAYMGVVNEITASTKDPKRKGKEKTESFDLKGNHILPRPKGIKKLYV